MPDDVHPPPGPGSPPGGPEPLDRRRTAPLHLVGRIAESSNATFLVAVGEIGEEPDDTAARVAEIDVEGGDRAALDRLGLKAVYKPLRGERPLWDFPEGLYRREVAAFELSDALGWRVVPGTVVREEAVLGVGSLQRFVEADFSRHYFALRDDGRHDDQLLRMAVFDVVANNTDRKAGHVLVDDADHVWGIDNGLCFSTEARLRTVIWDFAGCPVPADLLDDLGRLVEDGLPAAVTAHLLDDEVELTLRRARALLHRGCLPHDPTGRAIPWPLL